MMSKRCSGNTMLPHLAFYPLHSPLPSHYSISIMQYPAHLSPPPDGQVVGVVIELSTREHADVEGYGIEAMGLISPLSLQSENIPVVVCPFDGNGSGLAEAGSEVTLAAQAKGDEG